tara:strand:+ start:52 stop:285 length:234 start_codon:yes stop_codon:yes gene_type:complete
MRIRPKLDLHGYFHSEVFEIVDEFISENLFQSQVEIVTGYSPRMKEIVREVLEEYKLEGKEPLHNSGTLIVNILDKS